MDAEIFVRSFHHSNIAQAHSLNQQEVNSSDFDLLFPVYSAKMSPEEADRKTTFSSYTQAPV